MAQTKRLYPISSQPFSRIRVGISFSSETRTLDGWEIERD